MHLRYALLGLLQYKPMSGYDLEQFINTSTTHFWHAKLSQIYRTLKDMENNSLVVSHIEPQEGRPDRRVYTITDSGRKELEQWLAQYFTEPDDIKLPSLLKLFFMGAAPKSNVLAQLRLWQDMYRRQYVYFRDEVPNEIDKRVEDVPHSENDQIFWEATRRFGEMFYETYVSWLDETIKRVEKEMEEVHQE